MQNTSTFQYVVIGIFVVFIVVGIIIFAGFTGGNKSGTGGSVQVSVWGVIPDTTFNSAVTKVNAKTAGTLNVSYTEHSLSTFDNDLANAIAGGNGPDMVILPSDHLEKDAKLFVTIPYSVISQRTYQDTFATPASIFLNDKGVSALPISIDPLVLYWNKDIFSTAGIPNPPTSWKDLVSLVPKLSNITTSKTILQSAVSLGEYQNVKNAKAILSTLFLQAGNPITQYQNGVLLSTVNNNNAVQNSVNFYTQFANPSSSAYSWNLSLPSSDEMFLRGKSATYIGFASEYGTISSQNPNLNFDVAIMPQAQGATTALTYAKVYGVAIVSASKNQQSALANAEALVSPDFMSYLSTNLNLPSVRVDQLSEQNTSAFGEIFRRSVLIGRDWLDPDPGSTDSYFQVMIDSINNGSSDILSAVSAFSSKLQELLK